MVMATRADSDLEEEFELSLESTSHVDEDEEYELLAREVEGNGSEPSPYSQAYADRLGQMASREWEYETELDEEINRLMDDMEREFFFGKLKKLARRGAKGLIRRGLSAAKGLPAFQAIRGITSLARGDLRGMLSSLAKAGLSSGLAAMPGGAVALPALKALGFEADERPTEGSDWQGFVDLSQRAYENLADSLTEDADEPVRAAELAASSLKAAMGPMARTGGMTSGGARRVRIRPGERITIVSVPS
jgi:hypothetical protein